MTLGILRDEYLKPQAERPASCWHVVVENRDLGVIERTPAGRYYAFGPGDHPVQCLGEFDGLVEAGEWILLCDRLEIA